MRPRLVPRAFLGALLLSALSACSPGGGGGNPAFSLSLTASAPPVATGSQTIAWSSTGAQTVEVRLSSDSGATFPTLLATVAAAAGSWDWDTTGSADGTTYRIQVVGLDGSGSTLGTAEDAADFALDHIAPVVALTAPAGGELWGGFDTVTWTTTDAHPGTVEVRLSTDSGGSFPTVLGAPADTGSFSFDATAFGPGTTFRVQVVPTDAAGNVGAAVASPADFEIDPSPRLTGPARWLDADGDGQLGAGDQVVLAFHVDVAVAGATPADLALPVASDAFGPAASVAAGPRAHEVTVTLDAGAVLRSRHAFSGADVDAGSPSALDLSGALTPGAIVNALAPIDASSTGPVDLVPGFVPDGSWATSGGTTTQAQCLGDLDGDGAVDLVLSSDGASGAVWFNDASGNFTDSGQTPTFGAGALLAVADFDRDGDLDVFAGCPAGTDSLWLNDGAGTLTNSGQTLSTGSTQAVALGDFDRDGDVDAVAALEGAAAELWTNDGAGTLTATGTLLGAGSPRSLSVGDVDRDGDLDLLASDAASNGTVWTNDGAGVFTDSGHAFGPGSAALLVDVDGDGDLDAFVGHDGAGDAVWTNDGTGTFTDSGQALGSADTSALAAFDFDGDGDLDVAAGDPSGDDTVWSNDGAGAFSASHALPAGATHALAVADTDRDGDPDLVQVSDASGARTWRSSLSGTWGGVGAVDSGQSLATSHTADVTPGDLDGDGDLDMVCSNLSLQSRVWMNDGSGTFSASQTVNIHSYGIDLGDLDGDGDLDLALSDDNGPDQIWWNDGTGNFATSTSLPHSTSDNTTDVTIGDLDRDGDLDLLSASYFGNTLNPWRNDGGGVFTEMPVVPATTVVSTELVDVDADGDLDVVTASYGPERVFLNDGAGNFTDSGQSLGAGDTWRVAVFDAENDGDLDFVAPSFTLPATLWLNDGAGTFTASAQVLPSGSPTAVPGDVDGDGDTDVWFTGWNGTDSVLWLNDGTGVLSDAGFAISGYDTTDAALFDAESDGDLDFVTGNYSGQPNRVYRNDF